MFFLLSNSYNTPSLGVYTVYMYHVLRAKPEIVHFGNCMGYFVQFAECTFQSEQNQNCTVLLYRTRLHLIFIQNCTWPQRCTRFLYHVRKRIYNCWIVTRRVRNIWKTWMHLYEYMIFLLTAGEWVVALTIIQQFFFLAQASIGLTSLCAVTHYKSLPSCERWLGTNLSQRHRTP